MAKTYRDVAIDQIVATVEEAMSHAIDWWGTLPTPMNEAIDKFRIQLSPLGMPYLRHIEFSDDHHQLLNQAHAMNILLFGAPNFFVPRVPPIWPPCSPDKTSYYDNAPLRATLEQLVDFDRINAGEMRFSVGAVDILSGNFIYFDSKTHTIGFEHVAASGSLPPGFPATKIGDSYFWDGGLISNTPLEWVLDARPRRDTLAFQIDLWNARGELPKDIIGVEVRQKEIIYSSRNRAATDRYQYIQKLRIALANLLKRMPEELRESADAKLLLAEADDKVCNIVHLIYRARPYEGIAKDFEFSRRTMEEHWQTGYKNARRT
jgi:NTE family protein